ncbi:TIGR02450 family Trp-rich protein [Colwellia sp. RE-S-Sl-9]
MNKVSPKSLLHSKWTKVEVENREKHFMITKVNVDDEQRIVECKIEAVISKNEYSINWRDLKDNQCWKLGWQ